MRRAFVIRGTRRLGVVLVLVLAAARCGGTSGSNFMEPTPPPQNTPPAAPPATAGFSIAPGSGTLASTVRVTITGTGFVSGTSVTVGGTGVTVRNVAVTSNTTIQADLVIDGWTATLGGRTVTAGTATTISGSVPFTVEAGARFVDLGDAVRDTQWNLIWEKQLPAGSGYPRDVDNAFSWCEATGDTRPPGCAGNTASWINDFRNTARDGRALGDWRMPTRQELQSIIQSPCPTSSFSACIDPVFGAAAAARYWSSEESSDANAYSVSFTNGQVFTESKSGSRNRVRAVRPGP